MSVFDGKSSSQRTSNGKMFGNKGGIIDASMKWGRFCMKCTLGIGKLFLAIFTRNRDKTKKYKPIKRETGFTKWY